jgi:predicted DNA-binding transcriptional regulator AlpA
MPDTPEKPTGGHLDAVEAAKYMRLSRRRMDRYREDGNGPRFRKFGAKVVYTIADLDAWSAERVHQATDEPNYPAPLRKRRSAK